MNFIVQLLRQCWFVWQKIGLNQRITIVLFLTVIAGSLVAVGFWAKRPEYVLLYSRLDSADAAEIMAKLSDMEIPAKYNQLQSSVLVPRSRLDNARLGLAKEGLPKGDSVGFEIFDEGSLGMTDFMQKVNYSRAVQGQLARNIAALDEVDRARVMIAVPKDELFAEDRQEAKASVTLKLRSGCPLAGPQVNAIRHLVASAVPGLEAQNVTIIDTMGNLLSRSAGANSAAGLSDEQLALQADKEKRLTEKVQSMLETVLGPNRAIVRVSAELNFEQMEVTEERIDPDSAAVITETIETDDSSGAFAEMAGGAPGVSANVTDPQEGNTQQAQTPATKSSQTISNTYDYDRTSSRTVSEVGNVKRLSVAVFIAQKSEEKDGQRNHTARSTEELQVIENIVKSAVGYTENESRQDQVAVAEIPFDTSTADRCRKEMENAEQKDMIVSLVKIGGTCGVILAVLLFFKSFLKKAPPEHFPVALPVPGQMALPGGERGALMAGRPGPGGAPETGVEAVQAQVGKLADENPEQVAEVVKNWISEGS